MYRCRICDKKFKDFADLSKHLQEDHTIAEKLKKLKGKKGDPK